MTEGARGRQLDPAPRRRRWLALAIVVVLALIPVIYFVLRPRPRAPILAEAGQVQSTVAQEGDSLQVVVRWELAAAAEGARAESLRIEVRVDSMGATASRVRLQPGIRRQDTLYVPAPRPGEATEGLSCVAAQDRSMISRETCTPWRYVRPLAELTPQTPSQKKNRPSRSAGAADQPVRIVVQPNGLQVDPDIGGRCAEWQRRHPGLSVWVEVNRVAVPACTGPNNHPTVAQFCAFTELADGRRVKTPNSANNPYCDRLFRIWERERAS